MILQQRALTELEVKGQEYPPPADKVAYAQVVFYIQMCCFALAFLGQQICTALSVSMPDLLKTASENKFASFMIIWLIGNAIQANLLQTKAFEIYHADELVWSSLEEHRLPNMGDLITAFSKTGVEFVQSHRDE